MNKINKTHKNYKSIPNEIWEEVLNLFKKGLSLTKIIKQLNHPGLYTRKIAEYLRSKGLEVYNKQNERGTDHNCFNKITTEEQAYWLGFLYADGYISKGNCVELTVQLKDRDIVEKFKKFIKAENKFIFSKKWNTIRYAFNSKQIVKDLKKLGCENAKTYTVKFPTSDQVPKYLLRHFVRGYFDGDGCLGFRFGKKLKYSIYPLLSFIGTESILQGIIDFSKNKSSCKRRIVSDNGKIFEIKISSRKAISILNQMYDDCNIFMNRKYLRYRILRNKKFLIYSNDIKIINLLKRHY